MSSSTLYQRLLTVEAEFIQVVETNDLDAATAFEKRWSQLSVDLAAAFNNGDVDAETATLANSISSTVTIVSDLFISLRTHSDTVAGHLDSMFDGLNLNIPESSSPPTTSAKALPIDSSSLPSYIEPAYTWLLKHLHNPYPNKDTKQRLADQSGASIERISDWFIDVRRRMGWTQLLRDEFYRKRNAQVDAARIFFKVDRGAPLPASIEGRFVAIENYAKEMYAAKLRQSDLSLKLTTAINDLTPELQEKARQQRKLKAQRAAYPSPAPSDASSPMSDPGASTSRKRSSSNASDDEPLSNKRPRTDDGPDAFSMPSPPDSRHASPALSRKRRLSDADAPSAKRPRNRAATATVPLTVTLSETPEILADWFSSDREGGTNLFDEGNLLDIKFFNPEDYDFLDNLPPTPAEPVLQELKTLPQQTTEPQEMLSFEIPADIQNLLDFSECPLAIDFCQPGPPSFGSFADPYSGHGPAVYEAPTYFEPYNNGYSYNYITPESVTESLGLQPLSYDSPVVYSAFPGGKASSAVSHGYTGQNHKNQNEYAMYQPAAY
ncbi:hypothetical protein B0H15DRAFT_795494 [Mycena belliarum]|uniref:Homeobox domain-containing protein n=1 Tax=Mycena belliarum TaxID=1033014 RepID=A0AAD6UP93_9AGAR|nr:hypothetical protein B0H15DRAFT_795494 [Mycena belliae]